MKIPTKKIRKEYESYGFDVRDGDTFWETEYGWGWQVGQFTHNCIIETTYFVVVLVYNYRTDFKQITLTFDSAFKKSITV